jgi:hypothetical protein
MKPHPRFKPPTLTRPKMSGAEKHGLYIVIAKVLASDICEGWPQVTSIAQPYVWGVGARLLLATHDRTSKIKIVLAPSHFEGLHGVYHVSDERFGEELHAWVEEMVLNGIQIPRRPTKHQPRIRHSLPPKELAKYGIRWVPLVVSLLDERENGLTRVETWLQSLIKQYLLDAPPQTADAQAECSVDPHGPATT